MKSELRTRSLQFLAAAYSADDLRVQPEYQRGTKWKLPQKQGLIDSLLRGYQIPLFYVHIEERQNRFVEGVERTAWLVDGQQRLAAIVDYLQGEFSLPDPKRAKPGSVLPSGIATQPPWTGKKFEELAPADKERLLNRELLVVEMNAESNEVRDLFIRLQAGTPLTAQEKRDAWPGDFSNFVIKHAGKPGHKLHSPKRFFALFARSRGLSVDDGVHFVDGLAEARKFFAGLAMTIMVRERAGVDFVDLKGATINDFYLENLSLDESSDPGAIRVVQVLDRVATLPGFDGLREGKALSFQWAFHLALLVDALLEGKFSLVWQEDVVSAFVAFRAAVAGAQLHYKKTRESLPHFEKFGRLLSGSGSDTAEIIRLRHSFLLGEVYSKISLKPLDPKRLFDPLEKEVIWNRDRGICQSPNCLLPDKRVAFQDATIHHVLEHTSGGETNLNNGVLICSVCHRDRAAMQRLTPVFLEYLRKITTNPVPPSLDTEVEASGSAGGRLKVVIDWPALDVDRSTQTITGGSAPDVIVRMLSALIGTFGNKMEQQLTEEKIVRFPLSRDPGKSFLNEKTEEAYTSILVPGTDLFFCPHSGTEEKVKKLRTLFTKLVLPDDRYFPEGSVEISVEPTQINE